MAKLNRTKSSSWQAYYYFYASSNFDSYALLDVNQYYYLQRWRYAYKIRLSRGVNDRISLGCGYRNCCRRCIPYFRIQICVKSTMIFSSHSILTFKGLDINAKRKPFCAPGVTGQKMIGEISHGWKLICGWTRSWRDGHRMAHVDDSHEVSRQAYFPCEFLVRY